MYPNHSRSRRARRTARHHGEFNPLGIVIVALFPLVAVALNRLLQDTLIAFVVAIVVGVMAIALVPTKSR